MLSEAEYQAEYDKAAAELEAKANPQANRGEDGKFVAKETPATPEPEPKAEPVKPEAKPEPEPVKKEAEVDPLADIRADLEATKKALRDTQAWGTKNAQELARIKRESDERKRQAERPAILDANPELEQAIKFVVPQAEPQAVDPQARWNAIVEAAHPGIFDKSIEPELEEALFKKLSSMPESLQDPLIAIREITAEKIAFTERQVGKKFAVESAKAAQKSAMTVPGAGASGSKSAPVDADLEAKNRILNMSSAEFEAERRRVLGY